MIYEILDKKLLEAEYCFLPKKSNSGIHLCLCIFLKNATLAVHKVYPIKRAKREFDFQET